MEETISNNNNFNEKKSKIILGDGISENEWAFFEVFRQENVFGLITSFQKGKKYKEYKSGDYAAKHGYLSLLKLKKKYKEELLFSSKAMILAASNGHLEVLKWLKENISLYPSIAIKEENGKKKLKIWQIDPSDRGVNELPTDPIDLAASNGHLEVVKWLHSDGNPCTTQAMNWAACYGHLETVKWLHKNRKEGCTTKAMDWASSFGYLETVKWLDTNRTEGCTTLAMDGAAANGHLETVEWLDKNREEGCTTVAINYAARNGHLKIVRWFHFNRKEGCTTDAMNFAAEKGHLKILVWLHKNRTEGCTKKAMDDAAMNGHLEVVKWLHENRKEGFSEKGLECAARNGHIEIIKFLYGDEYAYEDEQWSRWSNQKSIGQSIIDIAVEYKRLKIAEYLIEKQFFWKNWIKK